MGVNVNGRIYDISIEKWGADNALKNPSFEEDSNGDGVADNWAALGSPVLAMESTIVLHGGKSQKITTDAASEGIASGTMIAPAGTTQAVAYAWVCRPASGADIRVVLRDTTAGASKDYHDLSEGGWQTRVVGANTWYRIVVSSSAIVAGNNHQLWIQVTGATATVFYTDKAFWKWGTTTAPIDIYGFMTALVAGEIRRRANDFAPVISVPGAQREYTEDVWQPWTMGDFRGGLGQENWEDPTKFYEMTQGLRIFKDRITLDTQIVDEDVNATRSKGVDFKGDHYAIYRGSDIKIDKRTTATGAWSNVKTLGTGKFTTDICVYRGRLWVPTHGDYFWTSADGTTWTQRQQPVGVAYLYNMLSFRNMIWACNGYKMWAWLDLLTTDHAGTFDIGDADTVYGVKNLALIGGVMAIGRTNGIYIYEGSGNRAEGPIIDFENMAWDGNCKLFTVVDGFLYYNVGTRVKRTDLQGVEFDITPLTSGTMIKDIYAFGTPVGGQGCQGHIYVAFDGWDGTNHIPYVLEMPTIDIGGWRLVYQGSAGATMNGCWFSDVADRLLIGDGHTRTQRYRSQSDMPYSNYVSTASLTTSWFDAGDVWSKKVFNALLAYARELTATETIKFEYEKDYSGSWVTITTISSGRENQVPFDPTNIAISARKLRLRITLSRGTDASKTPVLVLPTVASYVVRPDPTYAQQVFIILQDNILTHDGKPSEQTAATLKQFLRDCEAYEFPLTYVDRYGASWDVLISRSDELRQFKFTDQAGNSRQENVMQLVLKEV